MTSRGAVLNILVLLSIVKALADQALNCNATPAGKNMSFFVRDVGWLFGMSRGVSSKRCRVYV